MNRRFLRYVAGFLLPSLLPLTGFTGEKGRNFSGPTRIAIIPLAEKYSPELKQRIEDLEKKLNREKGIRVQDGKLTNELLHYYRSHIASTMKAGSQSHTLTAAREKIQQVRYDEAERLLNEAESEFKNTRIGSDLSQIFILKAKIFHSRNQEDNVLQQFEKLVRLNSEVSLDPKLYGQWAIKSLNRARENVLTAGVGEIEVISSPEASEIMLNGFVRGITPFKLEKIPVGRHVIEIHTVNHRSLIKEVEVKKDKVLHLRETLIREKAPVQNSEFVSLNPAEYKTDESISKMFSSIGYHLGVDKVVLISDEGLPGTSQAAYRLGDARLGAVYKKRRVIIPTGQSEDIISALADSIRSEAKADILSNPGKYTDQAVGDVALHEKRKKPLYKRPLFWVLIGAGAGAGGVLAAVLGGSAAAAGTGGVVIGL